MPRGVLTVCAAGGVDGVCCGAWLWEVTAGVGALWCRGVMQGMVALCCQCCVMRGKAVGGGCGRTTSSGSSINTNSINIISSTTRFTSSTTSSSRGRVRRRMGRRRSDGRLVWK